MEGGWKGGFDEDCAVRWGVVGRGWVDGEACGLVSGVGIHGSRFGIKWS